MGRKRSSEKVRILLLVEKDLLEKIKLLNVNRSKLMNDAMRYYIEKNGKNENRMD